MIKGVLPVAGLEPVGLVTYGDFLFVGGAEDSVGAGKLERIEVDVTNAPRTTEVSKYPDVKMASLMIEVSKYPDDEAAALKLEVALDVDVGVAETVSDTSLKTDVSGCTVGFAEAVAIAAVEEEVIVEKIALLIEVSKYAVADADAAVADDNTSLK